MIQRTTERIASLSAKVGMRDPDLRKLDGFAAGRFEAPTDALPQALDQINGQGDLFERPVASNRDQQAGQLSATVGLPGHTDSGPSRPDPGDRTGVGSTAGALMDGPQPNRSLWAIAADGCAEKAPVAMVGGAIGGAMGASGGGPGAAGAMAVRGAAGAAVTGCVTGALGSVLKEVKARAEAQVTVEPLEEEIASDGGAAASTSSPSGGTSTSTTAASGGADGGTETTSAGTPAGGSTLPGVDGLPSLPDATPPDDLRGQRAGTPSRSELARRLAPIGRQHLDDDAGGSRPTHADAENRDGEIRRGFDEISVRPMRSGVLKNPIDAARAREDIRARALAARTQSAGRVGPENVNPVHGRRV